MVCQCGSAAESGRRRHFFSHDHLFEPITINLRPGLACELLELRRLFRMPPATANHDAFGHDLAVADQVLADDVDIIEPALLDRDKGGVSATPRLEAAEFETPQRH